MYGRGELGAGLLSSDGEGQEVVSVDEGRIVALDFLLNSRRGILGEAS